MRCDVMCSVVVLSHSIRHHIISHIISYHITLYHHVTSRITQQYAVLFLGLSCPGLHSTPLSYPILPYPTLPYPDLMWCDPIRCDLVWCVVTHMMSCSSPCISNTSLAMCDVTAGALCPCRWGRQWDRVELIWSEQSRAEQSCWYTGRIRTIIIFSRLGSCLTEITR